MTSPPWIVEPCKAVSELHRREFPGRIFRYITAKTAHAVFVPQGFFRDISGFTWSDMMKRGTGGGYAAWLFCIRADLATYERCWAVVCLIGWFAAAHVLVRLRRRLAVWRTICDRVAPTFCRHVVRASSGAGVS